MTALQPGPTNGILDVQGLRVGHAQRVGDGHRSGTTVVLAPEGGAVAGVDVRGGGPGTRETDLLDPRNMVERIHAVVLTGGSAFGLATADGVMQRLDEDGVGLQIGAGPGETVPIVVGAVIFDLGRGGSWSARPGPETGATAYDDAVHRGVDGPFPLPMGNVGAGTGAEAGGLKGGLGTASVVLPDGTTVAALVVANPLGSCVDDTGRPHAFPVGLPGEFPQVRPADEDDLQLWRESTGRHLPAPLRPGAATTIGLVATDATLTKAQCAKVAGAAHDGMARAIRPVHSMFDGDTAFAMATGARDAPDPIAFHGILAAAADCFTRAIGHALLAAESVDLPAGRCLSWSDAFPSTRS